MPKPLVFRKTTRVLERLVARIDAIDDATLKLDGEPRQLWRNAKLAFTNAHRYHIISGVRDLMGSERINMTRELQDSWMWIKAAEDLVQAEAKAKTARVEIKAQEVEREG